MQRRTGELRNDLRFLMRADDPDFVYYIETRGRGFFLRASPIDVSRIVRESLFDRYPDGGADVGHARRGRIVRLRQGTARSSRAPRSCAWPSEFDFAAAGAAVPAAAACRRRSRRHSPRRSARETIELVNVRSGRAFVLFTSYEVLRAVQPFVEMALPYPSWSRASAPRSALIEQFRSARRNAVLLATSSFWQGVDVVGDALSCVDHRQAAVRVSGRSGDRGAHRCH